MTTSIRRALAASSLLLGTALLAQTPPPAPPAPAEAPKGVATQGEATQGQTKVKKPKFYRARHILIPWKGSPAAGPEIEVDEAGAAKLAQEIHDKLVAGEAFAALAEAKSSCPSKAFGGYLGQFPPGQMVPAFEVALDKVKVGELTQPIKTHFGWHVIRRMKPIEPWPSKVNASHILISWKGAQRADPSLERDKAAAKKLAEEIAKKVIADPSAFDAAAKESSDDKFSGPRGGSLGLQSTGRMIAPMADALAQLAVGKVGGPIETPFGFHILRRDTDPPPPMRARHILIPWKGARNAAADVTRDKDAAKTLADELLATLKAEDGATQFGALAQKHSSCPSKARGGDLGEFGPGQMVPAFEQAVVGAKVDQIVGPVESPFGWHVIQRMQ